jgi:hypothetical protein
MTSLHDPVHTIGAIAKATGINANTMRTWFKRGDLTTGMSDLASPGNTMARRFTGHTALAIAIMGALIDMGISPKRAALAANKFAHSGSAKRLPGELFAQGQTVLVFSWKADVPDRVLNLTPETPAREIFKYTDRVTSVLLDEIVMATIVNLDAATPPAKRNTRVRELVS